MLTLSFLLSTLKRFKITMPFLVILSLSVRASSPDNSSFKFFFKSGQYFEALGALAKVDSKDLTLGEKSYWEGVIYSKIQEFDKAIKSFENAILEKNETPDLRYEYGQALYATNELKAARKAFEQSVEQKFNIPASTYYIANISQMLDEYSMAKIKFSELITNPETDIQLKQIARFQLAETLLSAFKEQHLKKEEFENNLITYVIPMLNKAISTDKNAKIVQDIEVRLSEILKEYKLDPDLLKNGRRISPKRYYGYISQQLKSDSNVTLNSEENNIQQTTKASLVSETDGYAKYDFVFNKRFIIAPEFRVNYTKYMNQHDAEVYQNDSFSLNANLRNKYEHTLNNMPASFIFDAEYCKIYKDWNQSHSIEAYANSVTLGIGENFDYFKSGETTLRVKYQNYTGVNELISNHTISLIGDQVFALGNRNLLIALIEAEFNNNFNNPSTNSNTFMGRLDYLVPEVIPLYTLDLGFSGTYTDTKTQSSLRGMELTLNPSIDLSRVITDKIKININYDFSKNNSKSADYNYTKSVFSLGFNYSF